MYTQKIKINISLFKKNYISIETCFASTNFIFINLKSNQKLINWLTAENSFILFRQYIVINLSHNFFSIPILNYILNFNLALFYSIINHLIHRKITQPDRIANDPKNKQRARICKTR